jgi:hypothetical protein
MDWSIEEIPTIPYYLNIILAFKTIRKFFARIKILDNFKI